ncbi:hypothetical protein ACLD0W_11085 [Alloalcanivorax sp. C16-1]|uniref:hypothetical protein n=1 Tax=Alloalcanivorax sp. C16-1 TaxID=3390051 RepID=UPI003970E6A7
MLFPIPRRAPLALAVAGAFIAPAAQASLPDLTVPALTLKTLDASVRQFSGFDVAALPGERFAVVWSEYGDGGAGQVWLRRYDQAGQALADAVVLAEDNDRVLASPAIAADDAGNLWVSWGNSASADFTRGALCQTGMAMVRVSPDDTVTSVTTPSPQGSVCARQVAANAGGNAVLAWFERGSQESSEPLLFSTYGSNGGDLAGPVQVAGNVDFHVSVALNDDGTLLAAWEDRAVVYGQRFNLNGNPVDDGAGRLDQNRQSGASLVQRLPSVSDDADGGFVASWNQDDIIAEDPDFQRTVRAQRWAADGTAGDTLLLDNEEYDFAIDYSVPRVATDSAGNLVSVWVVVDDPRPLAARGTVISAGGEVIGERGTEFANVSDLDDMAPTGDPKVALSDDLAVVAWQGTAGDQAVLRAKVAGNALAGDGDDGAGGDGQNGGDGGADDLWGGGATGLGALLLMALLGRRRRRR